VGLNDVDEVKDSVRWVGSVCPVRWKEECHGDYTVTFDYSGLRVEF